jgi:hypothetical protein
VTPRRLKEIEALYLRAACIHPVITPPASGKCLACGARWSHVEGIFEVSSGDTVRCLRELLEVVTPLVHFAHGFASEVERARRARGPARGMQVPYQGDFAGGMVPSVAKGLDFWAHAARRALEAE